MKRIALIPAYKPENTMLKTVSELSKADFDIIIIDDGSGDEFARIFETAGKTASAVLWHSENKGKGAALKTGMKYISENYEPPFVLVTVDADGQHKTADALRLCCEAEKQPDSLILGSRKLSGSVPLRSRFGNTVTRFVFRISSGVSVYDTQTGLRAFSDKLLSRMLNIEGQRYEYEMNVLMQLAREHTAIKEIPIETVYFNGNSSSHFNTIKDSYRIYKEILKFSASSLISFFADYLLFCLLLSISGSITAANIIARICSGTLNFTLNRNMVFRSSSSLPASAAGYAALAAVILVFNTLIVKALCTLGMSAYPAKILTEIIMFSASWIVQHKFIFKRRQQQ